MDIADIRPQIRARLEAIRAERAELKNRDSALASAEIRWTQSLEEEERRFANLSSANGTNGRVRIDRVHLDLERKDQLLLSTIVLDCLSEGLRLETTEIAARAQDRGFTFRPKGAARATNACIQGLARHGLLESQQGRWAITIAGRAELKRRRMSSNAGMAEEASAAKSIS
jgi:hypothetical protein